MLYRQCYQKLIRAFIALIETGIVGRFRVEEILLQLPSRSGYRDRMYL
jgi:hypothetical protein